MLLHAGPDRRYAELNRPTSVDLQIIHNLQADMTTAVYGSKLTSQHGLFECVHALTLLQCGCMAVQLRLRPTGTSQGLNGATQMARQFLHASSSNNTAHSAKSVSILNRIRDTFQPRGVRCDGER